MSLHTVWTKGLQSEAELTCCVPGVTFRTHDVEVASNVSLAVALLSPPCQNQSVQVDPLLLGYPCRAVQLLRCFQHLCVEPLKKLLLRVHVEPFLFEVMGQSVDIWLHHLHQPSRRGQRQQLQQEPERRQLTPWWRNAQGSVTISTGHTTAPHARFTAVTIHPL